MSLNFSEDLIQFEQEQRFSARPLLEVLKEYGITPTELPESFLTTYVEDYPPKAQTHNGEGSHVVPLHEYNFHCWINPVQEANGHEDQGQHQEPQFMTLAFTPPFYSPKQDVTVLNDRFLRYLSLIVPKTFKIGEEIRFSPDLQLVDFRGVADWSKLIDRFMCKKEIRELYTTDANGNREIMDPLWVVLAENSATARTLVLMVYWFDIDRRNLWSLPHRISRVLTLEVPQEFMNKYAMYN